MTTKGQTQFGGRREVAGGSLCRDERVSILPEPTDEELNALIDMALREAKIQLAGYPPCGSAGASGSRPAGTEASVAAELVVR